MRSCEREGGGALKLAGARRRAAALFEAPLVQIGAQGRRHEGPREARKTRVGRPASTEPAEGAMLRPGGSSGEGVVRGPAAAAPSTR